MEYTRVKYPRTLHLPWSPGTTNDDRILNSCDHFLGKEVVVTEKMDGENTTMYSNAIHARSVTSCDHPSRSWVKKLHATIGYEIPEGWRVCGENLYARHSISYESLGSYFQVFSIWNEQNISLSWDDTLEWCEMLSLKPVRELWRGVWGEEQVQRCWEPGNNIQETEGYVVRLASEFRYEDFGTSLAKYVRKNHVQPNSVHWMRKEVIPNILGNV